MSLAAQLGTRADPSRRGGARRSLSLAAEAPGFGAGVIIHNLSVTGMLIETSEELATGEALLVEIPERGATPATIVWNSGRYFGCQFDGAIPAASVSAALLRSPFDDRLAEDVRIEAEHKAHSRGTRLWVISGLAVASWALVAAAAVMVL